MNISPEYDALLLNYLRTGSAPDLTHSAGDPVFEETLIKLTGIEDRQQGIATLDRPELGQGDGMLRAQVETVVGASRLGEVETFLATNRNASIEQLLSMELLDLSQYSELLVTMLGASGGVVYQISSDTCTVEERAGLRRRIDAAITDWMAHETRTIVAKYENGRDGLDLFLEYVAKAKKAVKDGISGKNAVAAKGLIWAFGTEVKVYLEVLQFIAKASLSSKFPDGKLLEQGVIHLEDLRDKASKALESQVKRLRQQIVTAGISCPRLKSLLTQDLELPRTEPQSGLAVYRDLLLAWGQGAFGSDLRPPNPLRGNADLRDKWVMYGGYTDWPFGWDPYDLASEINRLNEQLEKRAKEALKAASTKILKNKNSRLATATPSLKFTSAVVSR